LIIREEKELYESFEKRMRHFKCRKEGCTQPAVFMAGQQLVCNMCLRPSETAQAAPLSALDLRPEYVLLACSGARLQEEAEEGRERLCQSRKLPNLSNNECVKGCRKSST
jgi:hypothetical protein